MVLSITGIIAAAVVRWLTKKSDRCSVCGYINPGTNHQMKHVLEKGVQK